MPSWRSSVAHGLGGMGSDAEIRVKSAIEWPTLGDFRVILAEVISGDRGPAVLMPISPCSTL
jgi:hypothetical protein